VSADQPIRVLIVDDSAVVRGSLGRIIDAEADMCVVTTAVHGQDALNALRHTDIDVVLLDIEMPVMDGLAALPLILQQTPSARVLMISSLTHEGAATTMRALALGAVDFIHKPQAKDGVSGLKQLADQLVDKVRAVARGRVVRPSTQHVSPARPHIPAVEPRILAIAASTGGPNALAELVHALPIDFPLPVLVTQHMPPIFTHMLAQRLSREGALACDEARDGDVITAGRIYMAPGDYHLLVSVVNDVPIVRLAHGEPENHCRPSADPMFRSVAHAYGAGSLALVLTGMGDDGRRGCEAIVAAGGRVMVQDEASSVVWGMPGSVVESGVPCAILPLTSMAQHIMSLCRVRTP
jgi:two-component system chemotaxis response regulator CheB